MRANIWICIAVFATLTLDGMISNCNAQLVDGDIIISEFFEDVFQIDPVNRSQTNIFNQGLFLESIVGVGNTIFSRDFGEGIVEIDLSTGTSSLIAGSPTSVNELTFDQNENLIITGNDGVQHYNTTTGVFSTITTDGYRDVIVSAQGDIFVTDTFDGIGRLTSSGLFESIADPGFAFEGLAIASDGLLYSYSSFDGLFQINPLTGTSTMLESDIFDSVDDIVSFGNDALLVSGIFDIDGDGTSEDGLYRYDIATGVITSVFDETTDNLGFWSPGDVYVVGELNAVVPEPTVIPVLALAIAGFVSRRRK